MVRHLLRDLDLASIAEILGDAGRAEGMIADFRPSA